MDADVPMYFESWTRELTARANRVRQLIGDRHWASDGYHKEAILREFLNRHLPSDLSIARGFVRDVGTPDRISPEIDIQIADHGLHPPIFNESDLCITVPSALLAHIEVKTQLQKNTLTSALRACRKTRDVALATGSGLSPYGMILFYERRSKSSDVKLFRLLIQSLREVVGQMINDPSGANSRKNCLRRLPNSIVCLNRFVMFLVPEQEERQLTVKYFGSSELSASYGFADLFSMIRSRRAPLNITNEMDRLLETVPGGVFLMDTLEVCTT